MPGEYVGIRESFKERGASDKAAKTSAARIFISRGKGRKGRSARARELAADRKTSR